MLLTRKIAYLVVPVLAATALQPLLAGEPASAPSTSRTSHRSTAKTTAKSTAKSAAPATKSPITISLTSRIRQGNLVVVVDNVPVFNEKFEKSPFIISQTTTWDPVQVAPGKHKLTAKVYGAKGKTYLSEIYDLEVSRAKGTELRIRVKGDRLTVEPVS